jgi:hypothetical protein
VAKSGREACVRRLWTVLSAAGLRLAALAVVPGIVLGIAPAAAQTEFRGGGFVSDFSNACAAEGWGGANQIVARFRPAGEPGNSTTSNLLNLFFDSYAMHFAYPTGAPNTWLTTTAAAAIGSGFGVQTNPRPQVRILPPPTGTTFSADERHLVVEINHFSFVSNCRARVNLWLFRR